MGVPPRLCLQSVQPSMTALAASAAPVSTAPTPLGEAPVISARGLALTYDTGDGEVMHFRHRSRNRARRVRLLHRPLRLRQDHVAARHRRSRAADRRPITVNGMSPQRRARARLRLRLPGSGALSLAHHRRNVALPLEIMGFPATSGSAHRPQTWSWSISPASSEVSLAALGRHAAARLDRPRARLRPDTAADGRAVRRARRDRPRPAQRAAAAAVGRTQEDRVFVTHSIPEAVFLSTRSW